MSTQAKAPYRTSARSIALFAAIALAIISSGLCYTIVYERRQREAVARQLQSIAELKIDSLVQWRKERLGDGIIFNANIWFSEAFTLFLASRQDAAASTRLSTWMRKVKESSDYDRLLLYDDSGAMILAFPEDGIDDPVIAAAVPAFAPSAKADFVDLYRNSADGRIYMSIMVPIGDGDDRGVLALRIDCETYLYPFLRRWPIESASAETLLVRKEGADLVFLNDLRFNKDAALALRKPLEGETELPAARAVLGQRGLFEGVDYRGVPVLSFIAPVTGSPWFFVARMDMAEVTAHASDRRGIMALLVVALIGAEGAGIKATRDRCRFRLLEQEAASTAEIRLGEERLRLVLEATGQGIFDLDLRTGIEATIDEYARLLGYDPVKFPETDWTENIHPEDRERTLAAYNDCLSGHVSEYRSEFRQRLKDGSWKWFLSLGKAVERGPDGRAERILGIRMDIDEHKRAERTLLEQKSELEDRVRARTAELKASNDDLQSFAYSVAHDLRAPLRSIDGFARILQEEYGPALNDEGRRIIGVIRESDQRMDALIRDLLEFTRLGKADLAMAAVDMRALAVESFGSCGDPALLGTFDFSVGELPQAIADEPMMRRVWVNLLSNAVKYSANKDDRRIEVYGSYAGDSLEYSVRDHGAGFDGKYGQKLFGIFQRLHSAAEFPGTGVGLAIVKRIIQRHGGTVSAEGRVGEGATFRFSLPKKELA
ncbi:MAG: PAS domain-containing protein [Spirochaetes bacterium]|nr:PAS domain-containing protein [Spirochaetota bacterium]MBU1080397.1 PAS domain-containing protein [Spirochaetota bacterium]